jgi:hypothetical protein
VATPGPVVVPGNAGAGREAPSSPSHAAEILPPSPRRKAGVGHDSDEESSVAASPSAVGVSSHSTLRVERELDEQFAQKAAKASSAHQNEFRKELEELEMQVLAGDRYRQPQRESDEDGEEEDRMRSAQMPLTPRMH